jgi:hypothetical protein
MWKNERVAGANSVGDDRIFRRATNENERVAGANSVGDDRIFRRATNENERIAFVILSLLTLIRSNRRIRR